MKRYIGIFSAAALLAGCSSNDILGDGLSSSPESGIGAETVLTGNICDDYDMLDEESCDGESSAQTRATINTTDFSATWDVGDKVSVNDGTLSCVYGVEEGGDSECTFKVSSASNMISNATTDDSFYAFYPATAVTGWYDGTVTALIYAGQDYAENMPGDSQRFGGYYVTGESAGKEGSVAFDFHLAASIIDIGISSLGVTPSSISIRSNSGVSLAGKFTYDCSASSPVIKLKTDDKTDYSASTQSDVITVSDIPSGATYVRFYVLPVQLSSGITITVKDTDGNFYAKSTSSSIGKTDNVTVGVSNATGATACRPYYKKVNFGAASTATTKNNWMATIPGNTRFNMLSIPGSHDAVTYTLTGSDTKYKMSYTQYYSLTAQAKLGNRAFDLRPGYMLAEAPDSSTLMNYHGCMTTNVKFITAIMELVNFVKNNPTETVFVTMSKEDSSPTKVIGITVAGESGNTNDETDGWRDAVRTIFERSDIKPYLVQSLSTTTTLADCRGKVVVVSRTPYGTSSNNWTPVYGCLVRDWPDNSSGSAKYYNAGQYSWNPLCNAYIEDIYQTTDTDGKQSSIETLWNESVADLGTSYYYAFASMAGSFSITGSSYPSKYAGTMNSWVSSTLSGSTYNGRLGFVFGDFVGYSTYSGDAFLKAVINQNYKYVFQSRSRSTATSSGGSSVVSVVPDESANTGQVY